MDKSKAKQARELKRKAKKKEAAKAATSDPWKDVPITDDQFTCVLSGALQTDGECQLFILRKLPANLYAVASFRIDRGVIGLREAWGWERSSLAEFNNVLLTEREDGFAVTSIPAAEARSLIAGAARYADEHGFRLPRDWQRWAGLLGGIGEWRSADTGLFRPEYADTVQYAREHLVGTSVQAFFARPDIYFALPPGEHLPQSNDKDRASSDTQPISNAFIEPADDDYRALFQAARRRSESATLTLSHERARIGLSTDLPIIDDAIALDAAAMAIIQFGTPTHAKMPETAEAAAVEHYYRQIHAVVLGHTELTPSSVDSLRARLDAIKADVQQARSALRIAGDA